MGNKSRFEMSEDELMHYQQLQEKAQEPAKRAAEVLEAGIYMILTELGVDINLPIPEQQAMLGIIMQEHTDEVAPQLNGFYFYQVIHGEPVPYAWVGSARLDSMGKVWIDVWRFADNAPSEIGGIQMPLH